MQIRSSLRPGYGSGEAPEFVIPDVPQPAQRVKLQGIFDAVLHGVGVQGAAQQLAPEPGVRPDAFLQSCHNDHRPFPCRRRWQESSVRRRHPPAPGRRACPWAAPGSGGIPGTVPDRRPASGPRSAPPCGRAPSWRRGRGRPARRADRRTGQFQSRLWTVRWSSTAPTARSQRWRPVGPRQAVRPGSSGQPAVADRPSTPRVTSAPGSSSASTSRASLVRPPPPRSSSRRRDCRSRRSSIEVAPPIRDVRRETAASGVSSVGVQGDGVGVQQRTDRHFVTDRRFRNREPAPESPARRGNAAVR